MHIESEKFEPAHTLILVKRGHTRSKNDGDFNQY